MKTNKNNVFKIILPLLIVVIGVVAFKILVAHKRPPATRAVPRHGVLAQVIVAKRIDQQIDIHATGTISPKQEVSITPQVSGKLVYVAPSFEVGAYFAEGDLLLQVEDTDYRLAIKQAEAQVAKMEFGVSAVQSKSQVARDDWRRLHPDGENPTNPLVLYAPQLKDAQASLASAQAVLLQARVNLSRTRITAPFNCRVRDEKVAIGQYLKSGGGVAVLVGSTLAEAIVPIPLADLAWLRVPKPGMSEEASKAVVQVHSAGRIFSWSGQVDRSLGEVDKVGNMIRLAVTVQDPYNLSNAAPQDRPGLAIGMFVRVIFKGRTAKGVISVPVQALRENDTLWLMMPDNTLKIVPVKIRRREPNMVLIEGGLQPGDRVVVSGLSGVVDGMLLKLVVD